jgi:hypothetical protein
MKHNVTHSFPARGLSEKERSVTRWLIEHASCSEEQKKKYLADLKEAHVIGACGCGCASVDFAISGVGSDSSDPLDPFGDFMTRDRRYGVFVFSKQQQLAGIEIYTLGANAPGSDFPAPEELVPFEEGANQPPEPRGPALRADPLGSAES